MKKWMKHLLILTSLVCLFAGHLSDVQANTQDGLEVSIEVAEKEDEISLQGSVTNHNEIQVEDATLEVSLPEELELKEGSLLVEGLDIAPLDTYETNWVVTRKETQPQEEVGVEQEETIVLEEVETQTSQTQIVEPKDEVVKQQEVSKENVPTSDDSNLPLWMGLWFGSIIALVLLWKYRKLFNIFLCLMLMVSFMNTDVFAKEDIKTLVVEETCHIDGTDYIISMTLSYTIETLVEEPQEEDVLGVLYGIDSSVEDYDQDGLSNVLEADVLGSHPGKKDSNEDGILDGEEDFDQDALTNLEELEFGTNPTKADSDNDGLMDGQEVNEYQSDPLKDDSDEDGLVDGDEIILGLNPLNAKSDGETLDSERLFTQSLHTDNIEEVLLVDNEVIPSLTLTTTGNINKRISMRVGDVYAFGESRSLVGKPIEIKGEQLGEGVLSFTSETSLENFVICKVDDETLYLDTTYNQETNVLSASIQEAGVYFVLNGKLLLEELGVNAIPQTRASAMAQADITFVLDTTYSMYENLRHVQNNIVGFQQALTKQNISAAFALVDYQDLEKDGMDSTQVHRHQDTTWFYDMEAYTNLIANIDLGQGGDEAESAIDALETARQLDYRPTAEKWMVLITDAPYKVENRYGISSMEEEIALLKEQGIKCIVVSTKATKAQYQPLFEQTGGLWIDIEDDFYFALEDLAKEISKEIQAQGQWIYLDGPIPIPVQLAEPLKAGSTTDTDKDGIYDIHELGDVVEISASQLQQLIIQSGGSIPEGVDINEIKMYQYRSNPVEKDTDFDGHDDGYDANPKNNAYKAIMHYTLDDAPKTCQINFAMDYRHLIAGNPEVYSQAISELAVLYASDIYDNLYIEFSEGFSGGSDNPTIFASMLGLNDVQNHHIKGSDYQVDQDDETQVLMGHRKITYQGQEHEVLIVSLRGTNGTNSEWSSNFDVGADTSAYYNAVGVSHPHWKNKAHHKGFDVASNRVYDKLKTYISQYVDTSLPVHVLVNGHSRGAAIANILAKDLVDETSYQVYGYTYATPNTTTATNTANYPMIFNIMNSDDIIPYMPLTQWGFNRYGVNKSISVASYYEDSVGGYDEGTFEWLCGYDYNDDSLTQNTLSKIVKIANTREDFYRYTDEEVTKVWEDDLGHVTYNGAVEELNELRTALTNEKLLKFCSLSIQSGLLHHVEIHYCPAYLMQTLANMVTSVGPLLGRDVAGRFADAKTAFVASSGKVVIGGMTHPHMQPTYYLIVKNNFLPLD